MSAEPASKRVSPAFFAHAVLRTRELKPMADWYLNVLQAEVVFQNPMMSFMTYDDEHHRIAIIQLPHLQERPDHAVGLDHLAYTYASLGDLVHTYERLKACGILPAVPINHGPTTSLYYLDPDRNQVELQIDNFDSVESLKGWMEKEDFAANPIGVLFDAGELARRYHAGEPEAELKKRPPGGPPPLDAFPAH